MSEAERLWREAHRECAYVNEPENMDRSRDRARRHHAAIDAAVRAAFEAGREYNEGCYSMKAALDKDYPPLPLWLPGSLNQFAQWARGSRCTLADVFPQGWATNVMVQEANALADEPRKEPHEAD